MSTDQVAALGRDGRCCHRAELLWAQEELLVAALQGRPLATDSIDALPPASARILIQVCVAAGARLEHGTIEQLVTAAGEAVHDNPAGGGWWRVALRMPAPRSGMGRLLPARWKLGNARS